MTKKPKTVEFEEGWADELMEDMGMTQEDVDNLMNGIMQLVETGEIFEDATPLEDLDEEEILKLIDKPKQTRH